MNNEAIANFLAEQRAITPESLEAIVLGLEDLWERRLWHQLTDACLTFFIHPDSAPQRLDFYKVFILKFANNINQLKLVDLALKAATQCKDDHERLIFLQDVEKRVDSENSQDALVFASIFVARVKMCLNELEDAKKDLDRAEKLLDGLGVVETIVNAAFYDASSNYYQRVADFAAYYRNALLYLACIDISMLSATDRHARAYHLGISALLSKTIYNFGELLLHPILDVLADSANDSWLRDLLFAFNRGDLSVYEQLSNRIATHPVLRQHEKHLRQKIHLAALTEAVFRRPPHDRAMTFANVAQETKLVPNQIEYLIMKALSLGLVRGTIDQVDGVAHITWVQPKVLDLGQVANMRERLAEWESTVNHLGHWIEAAGKDVWAA